MRWDATLKEKFLYIGFVRWDASLKEKFCDVGFRDVGPFIKGEVS